MPTLETSQLVALVLVAHAVAFVVGYAVGYRRRIQRERDRLQQAGSRLGELL